MPSINAALVWATEVSNLEHVDAMTCLLKTLNPIGIPFFGKLTFSHFVIFAVRCFTFDSEDRVTFANGLRVMLETFSDRVSSLQHLVHVKLLNIMCFNGNGRVETVHVGSEELN